MQQTAVDHDAAADAGADRDVDQERAPWPRRSAIRRGRPRWRRSRRTGRPSRRCEDSGERHVLPAGKVGGADRDAGERSSGPGAPTPTPTTASPAASARTGSRPAPRSGSITSSRSACACRWHGREGRGSLRRDRRRRRASSVPPRSMARAASVLMPLPSAAVQPAMRPARSLAPKASEPMTTVSAPASRSRARCARGCRRRRPARCGRLAAGRQHRARLAQARRGSRDEALALDADARAEQRHEGDLGRERRQRGDRRVELQHDAGLERPRAISSSGARPASPFSAWTLIRSAPASANWLDLRLDDARLDHQMDMERFGRERGERATRSGKNSKAGEKWPSATSMWKMSA